MRPLSFTDLAHLDALCGRECCFALCRVPQKQGLQFYMQANGECQEYAAIPPHAQGFLFAPFEGNAQFLIQAECQQIPIAEAFALPAQATLPPSTTRAEYNALFEQYHAVLQNGELAKLVLARSEQRELTSNFSPTRAFAEACKRYPNTFCALLQHPKYGTWLCATPELLLRGQGQEYETMALAGTLPLGSEWDPKNKEEQKLVADFTREVLHAQICAESAVENLCTAKLQHLCTRFQLRFPYAQLPSIIEALHPTPAICGYPAPAARSFMASNPDMARGLYAGYMGILSPKETELYVTLRCMQISGKRACLYAGGGIMPDSDCAHEWAETVEKMKSMAALLA